MNGVSVGLTLPFSAILMLSLSACATAAAVNADQSKAAESASRISAGLSRLGASPGKSNCFAEKIAAALDAEEAMEAVQIVEASMSKGEMRSGVLGASAPVKQSFIRAHMSCSFF